MWARQLAWMQTTDKANNLSRWHQLGRAPHVMPEPGGMLDAMHILGRLGLSAPGMNGPVPVMAGQMADFVAATQTLITPVEIDAALEASSAYVDEYYRSSEKSTDAPWKWPMTDEDRAVIERSEAQARREMFGS